MRALLAANCAASISIARLLWMLIINNNGNNYLSQLMSTPTGGLLSAMAMLRRVRNSSMALSSTVAISASDKRV